MDLLGDFLLFKLNAEQGPLLFGGGSSVTQAPQTAFGGTRASRPFSRAGDILTLAEQAADDDDVAEAMIAILSQVIHP